MSAQRSDGKCKCAMDAAAAHATSIGPRRPQKHPRNSPARENFLLLLADAEQRDIAAATASMRFEGNSAPTLSPASSSISSYRQVHGQFPPAHTETRPPSKKQQRMARPRRQKKHWASRPKPPCRTDTDTDAKYEEACYLHVHVMAHMASRYDV